MTEPMRLGITMGDPAGIGPEIILKLFEKHKPDDCVVYGQAAWLKQTASRLGLSISIQTVKSAQEPLETGCVPVFEACEPLDPHLALGVVSARAGDAAYQCLERAIDDALNQKIAGIVTAPLNKKAIHQAGHDFAGHTEILAHRCGDIPVAMMLLNADIRVVLVTIHIALRDVAHTLSIGRELQTIELAHRACRELGIESPRVAVAGLNPHAGEDGQFGDEESRIIAPAIEQARANGINVTGPWSGDTLFGRARTGEFDVVVAQYHDQGLIPVKYLGLDQGVNVTVGLPFVRTSVDHGTAFDIVHQGKASEQSLYEALLSARQLRENRFSKNPDR